MTTKKPAPKKVKPAPKKEHPKGMPKHLREAAATRPAPKDDTPDHKLPPPKFDSPPDKRIPPTHKPDTKAVLALIPRRESRGSTEREGLRAETHYLTGQLGEELAKSNQRVKDLLVEQGISVRQVAVNVDPPQFMAFVNTPTLRQAAEKLAAIGESLVDGGKRPVPRMPTREEIAAVTPPKPKMPEEVKQKLREKAKEERAAKPHDNGDPVARLLRDAHTLDDVYKVTAKHLKVPEKELRAKYGHLNPGQQRMNCGNRLRGAWKKGLILKD